MKNIKNKVGLATAVILALSLCFLSVASLFSSVQAVPLTQYPDEVTLDNELFVTNAWVIKDSGVYKMWYTHSRSDMDLGEMADNLTSILSGEMLDSLIGLDLEGLLAELAAIGDNADGSMDDLWDSLLATTTVIGYATSTDGIDWTVQNDNVLEGNPSYWESVGMPCVINDGGTYRMWFTHTETTLNETELQNILLDLGDTDMAVVKQALIDLANSTSTAIGYAESTNGTTWTNENLGVVSGSSGSIWDSVAAPCVIEDGGTYRMWFTSAETSLTADDIDDILADIESFDIDDLLYILDNTGSVISYTQSADGITGWDTPTLVMGGSDGIWDSVATPCVIKNSDTDYEMWYTNFTTDLTTTTLGDLIAEMQSLEPDIDALWTSLETSDIDTFLTDLETFLGDPTAEPPVAGTFDTARAMLENTGTQIGYATSSNGSSWTEVNPAAISGYGGPWGSVAAPCVINDGIYKMWYTKGLEELTAQNIVSMLDGSNLPIGYATELDPVAVTDAYPTLDDDNVAIVAVEISGKNQITGFPAPLPGGVSAYEMTVSGDHTGINIVEIRPVTPFDSPVYDLDDYTNTDTFTITATASTPMQPPDSIVVKLVISLTGNAVTPYDLDISFDSITAAGPPEITVPEENPNTITLLRGDAKEDGVVNIVDAMFIAQYLVEIRDINDINAVNAACVKQEAGNGDEINIVDAMFIAQYLVEIRDENFNLVP